MAVNTGSILIVPTTSYELTTKKAKTPKKNAILCGTGVPEDAGAAYYDPRNFLIRGGHRAFEQKILNMNKSAIQASARAVAEPWASLRGSRGRVSRVQELRTANAVLAEELMKTRAGSDEVESLQDERAQLMDLLNSQRNNSSRLEATVAADAATIAELRSRIQAAESRLEDEVSSRQELYSRHKSLEADFKLVSERNSGLAVSSSEVEGRLRAAQSRVEMLEDELRAAKAGLQAEKAAALAERQRASLLQSDLTELQSKTQLAAAATAAEQAELERLRIQNEQITSANDTLRGDVARMREEILHLTAQGVAAQANCQELQQQREDLQLQLASTRDSLERRIHQLEVGWRDDSATRARAGQEAAAAAERAAAEELLAVKRQHVDELAAKQREWEAQLRLLDGERGALQRAHEEEMTRKDLELLEVRERMRDAHASVADLATEVAKLKYQGEHYAAVSKECEDLKQRLEQAEETVKARDASLAEAAASHAAQLELWKAEANEVAQAAAKWKQRCTVLQAQLDEKDTDAEAEAVAGLESKLALANQEANSYQ
ncbi:hypothetical protein GPECTOR_41g709 [Gonium pectorale]|uniref:Uncharacterized protein n=1 Tax=Gonium pectorale TaxID=33097 RepID=A0A150GA80_GONPE|nr:hypothetical protein GPECTOR_41g709 [Gonium pectorale]|eukprot:KXZ46744.1 hypothetical protein GPECTOR_41g709 [Gonium pectorale]